MSNSEIRSRAMEIYKASFMPLLILSAINAVTDIIGNNSDSVVLTVILGLISVVINIGGYIVDDVPVEKYDYIFTCGPKIMMQVLADKVKGSNAKLYVSMENRMACGAGACLVCTCKTSDGNKKVCKDGPVFLAEEVFFHA